jgi:hypothetical protein
MNQLSSYQADRGDGSWIGFVLILLAVLLMALGAGCGMRSC